MGNKKKSIVIKKKICEPSSCSSSSSSCSTSSTSCGTLCDPSSCSSSSSSCSSPRTRVIIVDPSKCSDSSSSSSSSSSCSSSSESSCSDSSCSDCGGKKKEKKCHDNRKGHCSGNNRCGCGDCSGNNKCGCGECNGNNRCGGGGCCTNNGCCGGNTGCVVKVNARVMGNSFTPYCSTPAPVSNLSLIKGNSCGTVPFFVSINCRTVTISWDGFSGQVDSGGAAYIYIRQCFAGLPSSNTFGSYLINVKGTDLLSVVEVNSTNGDTIRWYFYPTRKGTNISRSDSFTIYPGSITYTLSHDC